MRLYIFQLLISLQSQTSPIKSAITESVENLAVALWTLTNASQECADIGTLVSLINSAQISPLSVIKSLSTQIANAPVSTDQIQSLYQAATSALQSASDGVALAQQAKQVDSFTSFLFDSIQHSAVSDAVWYS